MKTSPCRSCGAPVIWAVTAAGNRMPVDPEPDERGNIVLIRDDPEIAPTPRALVAVDPAAHLPNALHLSHFVTCPQAAQHRRRR